MKIEKKNTPKGPNQNQRFFFFCSATNPAHTHHQVSTSFAMITKYFNTVVVKYNPLLAACKYCTFFLQKKKKTNSHCYSQRLSSILHQANQLLSF